MAYKFQFRDVFARQDAILDGMVLTLQLSVGTSTLGFVLGVLVAATLVQRLLDAISRDVADALSNQALWNAPI